MLAIRLARGGAKKRPYYRLVVTDSRKARDSGAIKERVGYFNPVAKGEESMIHMDTERLEYWLSQGAQPSSKVAQLIKIFKKSLKNNEKPVMRAKQEKAKPVVAEAAAEEAPKEEAKAEAAAEEAPKQEEQK
jgi:small subunit ribosomal protein S16